MNYQSTINIYRIDRFLTAINDLEDAKRKWRVRTGDSGYSSNEGNHAGGIEVRILPSSFKCGVAARRDET